MELPPAHKLVGCGGCTKTRPRSLLESEPADLGTEVHSPRRAHSSIGQSVRLINGWFLVRTQVGLPSALSPRRGAVAAANRASTARRGEPRRTAPENTPLGVATNSLYRHRRVTRSHDRL